MEWVKLHKLFDKVEAEKAVNAMGWPGYDEFVEHIGTDVVGWWIDDEEIAEAPPEDAIDQMVGPIVYIVGNRLYRLEGMAKVKGNEAWMTDKVWSEII